MKSRKITRDEAVKLAQDFAVETFGAGTTATGCHWLAEKNMWTFGVSFDDVPLMDDTSIAVTGRGEVFRILVRHHWEGGFTISRIGQPKI